MFAPDHFRFSIYDPTHNSVTASDKMTDITTMPDAGTLAAAVGA